MRCRIKFVYNRKSNYLREIMRIVKSQVIGQRTIMIFRQIYGERWELNGAVWFLGVEEVTPPWYIAAKCSYTAVTKTYVEAPLNYGLFISVTSLCTSLCTCIVKSIIIITINCNMLQKLSLGICSRRAKADRLRDTSTQRYCTVMRCTFTVGWRTFKKGTTAGDGTSTAPRGPCWRASQVLDLFTATRRAGCQVACWSLAVRAAVWRQTSFGDFISVFIVTLSE